MIRLSEKYADRPAAELPLLFQRILSNATMDWFRRQKVRNQVVRNFSDFESAGGKDDDFDILETLEALGGPLQSESAAESVSRAQILQTIEAEVALLPGPSTRGLSPALLGGTRCRRDRRLDGVFRRERQDALLARRACLGEGPEGEGNHDMKNDSTYQAAAREAAESRFARSVAACLSESAETVAPDVAERLRFAREKSLEIARALARRTPQGRRRHRLGRGHRRLQPVALVAALRLGPAAGRPGRRPGPDPGLAEPHPDLGRRRGRRSPARRRPADQRLSRSRFLGVPEGAAERMSRAAMKREPTPEGRALPLAAARRAALRILAGAARRRVRGARRRPGAARCRRRASAAAPSREEGVRWPALTPAQREALAPLEHDWPGIDAPRKQKWIALAARFKTLSPEERARIHDANGRMGQAHPRRARPGPPSLRGSAPAAGRPTAASAGSAYQALPPEQRQQLAARAATAASAPRDAASKPAKAGRDSKEAKFNVVPNPALAQPPRPVAPTHGPGRARGDDDADHAPPDAAAAPADRACRRSRRRPSS